jgi:hypothetical protein
MPRAKKDVVYNADAETIREYFLLGRDLDEQHKAARAEISDFNKAAEQAGVHGGALALARRIARMPGERRRLALREPRGYW